MTDQPTGEIDLAALSLLYRTAYRDYVFTIIQPGEQLPYSQHLKASEKACETLVLHLAPQWPALQNALADLLDLYVAKAESQNRMWRWDPEDEAEVKNARAILDLTNFRRREISTDA